jgi:hypothetical protein
MSTEQSPEAGVDSTPIDAFLAGAGEMGALLRSIDWSQTQLGAIAEWPQSLRTTMSICLNSRFPIAVSWGPEYLLLYNASLLPIRDEASGVGGVFCAVVKTTDKVIEERRLRLLNALADGRRAPTVAAACAHAATEIARDATDVPFAALYLTSTFSRSSNGNGEVRIPDRSFRC